jgi:chromosome segregation ATPase
MTNPLLPEKTPQVLDVALSGGKIFRMMRSLFGSVIRASVLEAVAPMFAELKDGQRRLEVRMDRMDLRMDRIELRMDRFESRMDGLGGQMEGLRKDVYQLKTEVAEVRVDVAALKGEVGALRVEVNSLKRDRDSADNLAHRVMRIEDHLFAKA